MKIRNIIYPILVFGLASAGPKYKLENGTKIEFENAEVAKKIEIVYTNCSLDDYFVERFPTKERFIKAVNVIDGDSKDKIKSSDIDKTVNKNNLTLENELEKIVF